MFKLEKYSEKIMSIETKVKEVFAESDMQYQIADDNKRVKIVFAGQYSAGKSSIIKMLTGREDIVVGADITTQKADSYEWNGLEIVDTPGIHTQLRPDHDEISYKAISSADMLVFVITNELFDDHLANHFRKLAIDKDKAGEMILVVNKMDRTSEGNTLQQQEIIREDLRKVVSPYTPEQLRVCFLDAESYLEGIRQKQEDPELAEELLKRSGYDDFVKTLNFFVEEKRISGTMTTKLYKIQEELQKAMQELDGKNNDDDIRMLVEKFMQQRHILVEERYQLHNEVLSSYLKSCALIRDLGRESANEVTEECNQEQVEQKIETNIRRATNEIDECQDRIRKIVEDRLSNTGKRIEQMENSKFSMDLKIRLNDKYEGLPDNVKKVIGNISTGSKNMGKGIVESAYKPGVNGGMKLTNFSGSRIHDIVLKAGSKFGYKFKPWEAVKLTKTIAKLGGVLSAVGIFFEVAGNIKDDMDQEAIRDSLKKTRQEIRSHFNIVADKFEAEAKKNLEENILCIFDESILEIDDNIKSIHNSNKKRNEQSVRMDKLCSDCSNLIQEIHQNA